MYVYIYICKDIIIIFITTQCSFTFPIDISELEKQKVKMEAELAMAKQLVEVAKAKETSVIPVLKVTSIAYIFCLHICAHFPLTLCVYDLNALRCIQAKFEFATMVLQDQIDQIAKIRIETEARCKRKFFKKMLCVLLTLSISSKNDSGNGSSGC
jgi:hypothetical protein